MDILQQILRNLGVIRAQKRSYLLNWVLALIAANQFYPRLHVQRCGLTQEIGGPL